MSIENKEVVIRVEHVTKSFKIPLEASSGLKQKVINTLKGRKGYRDFKPLNDISFNVNKGDFFGIVGRNGSGKSTLLKTLAEIYTPNIGKITVNGTLVPFIELGVGFNPELTGKENVYLNGALLGFSRKEMDGMYSAIIDFAELGDFMEERLKNYSSGMQVRLAFSIAIQASGDILLLDEVLAVGDEAFQEKCFKYFEELKQNKRTVILVTHDMSSIERFCNRALLLEKGSIVKIGTSLEIAKLYRDLFVEERKSKTKSVATENLKESYNELIRKVEISAFQKSVEQNKIRKHEGFSIKVNLQAAKDIENTNATININNSLGQLVIRASTHGLHAWKMKKGENIFEFEFNNNILSSDEYSIDLIIERDEKHSGRYAIFQAGQVSYFEILGKSTVASQQQPIIEPKVTFKSY